MNTVKSIAISVDILFCSWIWNTSDVTISSMCGLALRKPAANWKHSTGIWLQQQLGKVLNWIQTNHCELAIASDISRATSIISLLK